MKLEKNAFYILKDITAEKPRASSFYDTQLFRAFQTAAARNGFNVVTVRSVPDGGRLAVEVFAVSDVDAGILTKAVTDASKTLKRTLALSRAVG